jgi:hypothetical protein
MMYIESAAYFVSDPNINFAKLKHDSHAKLSLFYKSNPIKGTLTRKKCIK